MDNAEKRIAEYQRLIELAESPKARFLLEEAIESERRADYEFPTFAE